MKRICVRLRRQESQIDSFHRKRLTDLENELTVAAGEGWVEGIVRDLGMDMRRKWQPTPVFLPGESQGRQSLVGCRLWGRTELDTTEAT